MTAVARGTPSARVGGRRADGETRQPGDPSANWWTYRDLEAVFGTTKVQRRIKAWEADGFPKPLPWSLRDKRWNPAAVLAWKARQEAKIGAAPPLRVVKPENPA